MISNGQKLYDPKQWQSLLQRTIASINQLSTLKGGEYAGDDDRLANFRRNAQALGVPMELIWAVYAGKHWDAIQQYVKDRVAGRERQRAEPLAGRLDDLIVYCILMKAMVEEIDGKAAAQSQDQSQSISGGGTETAAVVAEQGNGVKPQPADQAPNKQTRNLSDQPITWPIRNTNKETER